MTHDTYGMEKHHSLGKIFRWQEIIGGDHVFMRDGILLFIAPYTGYQDYTLLANNYTLEEVVEQAESYRTFTDYTVVRTNEPNKTYIPYSLYEKIYIQPPEWAEIDTENHDGCLKFPYITLDSLQVTPELESISFFNTATKEIIGTESLQYYQKLKQIWIYDELSLRVIIIFQF